MSAVDPTAAAGSGYAPALNAGFRATTARVQEMHHAISGKTFKNLGRVPVLSVPARIVQRVMRDWRGDDPSPDEYAGRST